MLNVEREIDSTHSNKIEFLISTRYLIFNFDIFLNFIHRASHKIFKNHLYRGAYLMSQEKKEIERNTADAHEAGFILPIKTSELPSSTSSAVVDLSISTGRLEGRLVQVERQIQDIDNTVDAINVSLGIIAVLLTTTMVAAAFWIKKRTTKLVSDSIQRLTDEHKGALQNELSGLTNRLEKAAEEKTAEAVTAVKEAYFKFSRILSLVEMKKYDAALEVGGVTDIPEEAHKALPEEVQAALIKSLCRSRLRRAGDLAWRWACDLAQNRTKTALRCLLESASKISREDEAIAIYDDLISSLSASEKLELEPILLVLLRRGKAPGKREEYSARLTDITRRHEESEDISVVVNIAAIYRDWGYLDHADSMLRSAMHKAREAMEGPWDDAFSRLLTTHIANCVDRNEPEKGVDAAKLLLAHSNRPDQVFACIRVAWRLPNNHDDRVFFAEATLNRLKDGYLPNNDDGTWKSVALAYEIMGKSDDCDHLLSEQIGRLQEETPNSIVRRFIYFLRCSIAEIHIQRGTKEWLRSALSHLSPAIEADSRGEASFLAACAYSRLGEIPNVVRSLENARIAGGNRWLSRAKSDSTLSSIPEVTELHARWARTPR